MDFRDRFRFTVQPNDEPSSWSPEANYYYEPQGDSNPDPDDHDRGGDHSHGDDVPPDNDPAGSPEGSRGHGCLPRGEHDVGRSLQAEAVVAPPRNNVDEDRFRHIFSGVLANADSSTAATTPAAAFLESFENDPSGALEDNGVGYREDGIVDLAKMQDRLRLEAAFDVVTTLDAAVASCKRCGTLVPSYCEGIFCANAFWPRQRSHSSRNRTRQHRSYYPACFGVWCGSCYSVDDESLRPLPSSGNTYSSGTDNRSNGDYQSELLYRTARNGDHLMTMFQCEACHFANLQGREPSADSNADRALLRCIRRATLDAFGGTAPADASVEENRRAFQLYLAVARELGAVVPLPPPFALEDDADMALAAIMVAHLANSGSPESDETCSGATARQKFDQALRMSNAVRNLHKASAAATPLSSPVTGPWFERFVDGLHLRVLGAPRTTS